MAPFSPSRFLNPLSSSTPRHVTRNGSPRKRVYPFEADKENQDVNLTPKRPNNALRNKENLPSSTITKCETTPVKESSKMAQPLTPKRNVSLVPRTPTPFKVYY